MAQRIQFGLPGLETIRKTHGGTTRAGKRKEARPIAVKRAMHIVMRAESARGDWSMLRKEHARFVQLEMRLRAKRYRVRVLNVSNNGNHLHFLVQAHDRKGLQSFLRVFSGRIAQHITGARKGIALGKRFWDAPVFSRIVEWGRDFLNTKAYVCQNLLEASGALPSLPPKARRTLRRQSISEIRRLYAPT